MRKCSFNTAAIYIFLELYIAKKFGRIFCTYTDDKLFDFLPHTALSTPTALKRVEDVSVNLPKVKCIRIFF